MTLGAGQFCTNPGLVLAVDGPDLQRFLDAAKLTLSSAAAGTMLTAGILHAYQAAVARLEQHGAVEKLGEGQAQTAATQGRAGLFVTRSDAVRGEPRSGGGSVRRVLPRDPLPGHRHHAGPDGGAGGPAHRHAADG